jgi:mono/diheme cytochrome c family protein
MTRTLVSDAGLPQRRPGSHRTGRMGAAAFLLCALACSDRQAGTGAPHAPGSSAASPAAASPAVLRARMERARKLFLAECSGCHGERGRGDGPVAETLDPKPRDLTRDRFRYRTTPSGEPPRREDLLATIERGLPGSAMPAFRFLSEEERGLLADYVQRLAGIDPTAEPAPVSLGVEVSATGESVARGQQVYLAARCDKCHGESGKGDGTSAPTLKDERGNPISVRDFSKGLFRRGASAAEVVRTFRAGLDGTPMPAYGDDLGNQQSWDLARFVLSLAGQKPAPPADPVAHGRLVMEEKQCNACHVIGGRGGRVGPSLDVSAKKLRLQWIREFLANPRAAGKIYPFTPYRMPDLQLAVGEVEAVVQYLAQMAGRPPVDPEEEPAEFAPEKAASGQLFYVIKCAECHNLGSVISTPEAKRQGPDLIHIRRRLRFNWIPEWVANPQAVYPGTSMVDTNLTPDEVDVVRAFLWGVTKDAGRKM